MYINTNNFEVLEYCESEEQAREIIRGLPKSNLYQYEVGKYE